MAKKSRLLTILMTSFALAIAGLIVVGMPLPVWAEEPASTSTQAQEVVVEVLKDTTLTEAASESTAVAEDLTLTVTTVTEGTASSTALSDSEGALTEPTMVIVELALSSQTVISDEVTGEAASVELADSVLAISEEVSATTSATSTGASLLAISDEIATTTLPKVTSTHLLAISDEVSATTLGNGGGCTSDCGGGDDHLLAISEEISATTAASGTSTIAISDEVSATTLGAGDGGCTSNCGGGGGSSGGCGGGGGGSSGGGRVPVTTTNLLLPCTDYLLKYIKWGQANDPFEVRKLQLFLREFQGFKDLAITGVYDLPTYEAVRVFQLRYGRDVLGPWGIDDATGYVFITTTRAINHLYCQLSTANNLDLRHVYDYLLRGVPAPGIDINTGTTTVPEITATTSTSTVATTTLSRLQAAALGFLNSIRLHGCWWLVLLLSLIILALIAYILLNHYGDGHGPDSAAGEEVVIDEEEQVALPGPDEVSLPLALDE